MSSGRILHLGLGAFHRAHQAAFTQDAGLGWNMTAVSMRNPRLADLLAAQHYQFTLIERHPEGPRFQKITVIDRTRALPRDLDLVLDDLADPDMHIVTLTVTEKGYGADLARRSLDPTDPAVAHDLNDPEATPRSLPGLLVRGLAQRRADGSGPVTLLSCDNLPENGALLAALVHEMAEVRDKALGTDLAKWIASECTCPNTMVDRITPASSERTHAEAQAWCGRPDPVAVETEPFRQWVIEDRFAGPRPDWHAAGAIFASDIRPFETMKLRMLNGAHSLIAYCGLLADLSAVRDVMANPVLRALVARHMTRAAATLEPPQGLDPKTYASELIARFENPQIDHLCAQIAMDGSQKLPQRIFAPARQALDSGLPVDSFAFCIAAWLVTLRGRSDAGNPIDCIDPMAAVLQENIRNRTDQDVLDGLASSGLAHHGLCNDSPFRAHVIRHARHIQDGGILNAAAMLLRDT